jgi:hypothetical protein
MDLRNVGILSQHYTASQTRRLFAETKNSYKISVGKPEGKGSSIRKKQTFKCISDNLVLNVDSMVITLRPSLAQENLHGK